MTFIRRPCARSATIEPILPAPIRPSILLVTSTPMKRFFSHLLAPWSRRRPPAAGGPAPASCADGMLGRGDRIAEGRVHHDDALLGRRRNVDIVDADAGAADHLEILRRGDDLLGDLARRADGEAIILADDFEQLVLVLAQIGQVVDLDAIVLEDLDGGLAEACRKREPWAWRPPGFRSLEQD